MFARTERLLLRPGWPEDAAALAKAIGDQAVSRNLVRVPWPYSIEDAAAFLTRERDDRLPSFLIFSRTMGAPRLIGGCGIDRRDNGELELGYWISRAHWGLGFATEAVRATMRIAHASGLTGIKARHMIDNRASGNVLRKAGFVPSGSVERLFSHGRGEHVMCLTFEQGEANAMRGGSIETLSHNDLYSDAELIAA